MSKVHQSNIRVHTQLVETGVYQKSVHRSDRNKKYLKKFFSNFKPGIKHLDIGCGDGFIFECTENKFLSYGIDITPAMIKHCSINHPEVILKRSQAEKIPFDDKFFNLITAYSFLDHLYNRKKFYNQCFNKLKKGGVLFIGLIPNKIFYDNLKIKLIDKKSILDKQTLKIELNKAFDDGNYYEKNFNIKKNDLEYCEPGKTRDLGIDPYNEISFLKNLGFKNIEVKFDWIVSENKISNKNIIKNLYSYSDLCSSAFKYFDIYAEK